MPDNGSTVCACFHFLCEIGALIIPTLKIRRLRLRVRGVQTYRAVTTEFEPEDLCTLTTTWPIS